MPKLDTTVQIRPDSSTPGVLGSHAHMIERLRAAKPPQLHPAVQPYADELEHAGDHVFITMLAVKQYLMAYMRDVAAHSPALNFERGYIEGCFDELKGELEGSLRLAAETVREEGVYTGRAA